MKKVCWMMILFFVFNSSQAQTFSEWFKQKKTQIKYLVNQVAALQVYIELGQKGYKIVDQGLTTIGDIKRGDLNLHAAFFTALKSVNPKIRNAAAVGEIIALQVKIVQAQQKALQRARANDQLTQAEISYIGRVYVRLLEQTADNLEQFFLLITANNYELSDDQWLKRINELHSDMQDKYRFARWFDDQTGRLIGNRQREKKDARILQSLINVPE